MFVATARPEAHFSKDHPFSARMTLNRLLTKPGSAKETRHLELSLAGSGLSYTPGDSLGVFPTNRPADVDEILERMGANGTEPVVAPRDDVPTGFRDALYAKVSLSKPTRKSLEFFLSKATDLAERARLEGLLSAGSKVELDSFLENREFVDLLAEFPSAVLTPQEFISMLRRLMPRLYSIASSQRVHGDNVHLTVAAVRYETNGRKRAGVCSTYLADRIRLGETPVPVFVSHSHFGLPKDDASDLIMIGPGTGVAPFRAILQERRATGAKGRNWLFFGDQRRATDYLYEEEFEAFKRDGHLARIDLAFSRDQAHKIYVQDRMREAGAELWAWIDGGAHFCVCGDAKRMAKDVDAQLHAIIQQHGGMDVEAAIAYVKQMKKERRYQRDVY